MAANPKTPPPTIAVDFDGTICDFAYPGIGKVKEGARNALALFRKLGFRILIYSCRTCHWHYDIFGGDPSLRTMERSTVKDMIAFLKAEGIEYDEIDDGSKGKPLADYYIDDKGIQFENNWDSIARYIEANTILKLANVQNRN
jgi:hypothetical protein